jgi:C-terminal processing protease CtpA/Prc
LDSLVVTTNKELFSLDENKKVIVLVDHNTACAAELFVNALKGNRKGVMVVGRERSAGSVTPTYNVMFDDKYKTTLLTGSYAPYKYVQNNHRSTIAIKPDIIVEVNNVLDLQPYNDKVLIEAMRVAAAQ